MKTHKWVAVSSCWMAHILCGQTPEITRQPEDLEVTAGNPAVFAVEVSDPKAAFQWLFEGNEIEEANQQYLFIPNASDANQGAYSVRIWNNDGTVVSDLAQLRVYDQVAGIVDRTYTSMLPVPDPYPIRWRWNSRMVEVFADGSVWLAGHYGDSPSVYPRMTSLRSDGSVVADFDRWCPFGAGGAVTVITPSDEGALYLGGYAEGPSETTHFVVRALPDGTTDQSFSPLIMAEAVQFVVQHRDGLVVGAGGHLQRFHGDGTLDTGFSEPVERVVSGAIDATGTLVVATGDSVLRLQGDGSIAESLGLEALGPEPRSRFLGPTALQLGHDGQLYVDAVRDDTLVSPFSSVSYAWNMTLYRLPNDWSEAVTAVGFAGKHYFFTPGPFRPSDFNENSSASLQHSFAVPEDGRPVIAAIPNQDLWNGGFIQRFTDEHEPDPLFHGGRGPDGVDGGLAVGLDPNGLLAFLVGNFTSFDGHRSPGIVRLRLQPQRPLPIRPRIVAMWAETAEVPEGHPFTLYAAVAGTPPFEISEYDGQVVEEIPGASPGLYRMYFESGTFRPLRIANRFGQTTSDYLADGYFTYLPSAPLVADTDWVYSLNSDRLSLRALVQGSKPVTVEWLRHGRLVGHGESEFIDGGPELSGDYQCVVTNPNGRAQSEIFRVDIEPAPPVIVWFSFARYSDGPRFSLHFRGTKPLTLTWFRDGQMVKEESVGNGERQSDFYPQMEANESSAFAVRLRSDVGEVTSPLVTVVVDRGGRIKSPIDYVRIIPSPEGPPHRSRLENISVRALNRGGGEATILGFVVRGEPGVAIARAIGPGLQRFGVANPLADPFIKVFDSQGRLVGTMDIPIADRFAVELGAFGMTGPLEAAVAVDLDEGEPVTLLARDAKFRSGTILLEGYRYPGDSDSSYPGDGHIVNFSARALVVARSSPAIGGFVISGQDPMPVLIRAAGPSLSRFGIVDVLKDPVIEFRELGADEPLAANDDWETPGPRQTLLDAFQQTGAFAFDSGAGDAAIVTELKPGAYTFVVAGKGDAEGIVLLEVYDLSDRQ